MFAGTRCLLGRDVFYPGFTIYMRMFLPKTISPGTICKVSIISFRQSGTECLFDKNCPALAGIPVCRTGRKTSRQNSFHINGTGQMRDIYMHGEIPFNVPSRLPYKQPLMYYCFERVGPNVTLD